MMNVQFVNLESKKHFYSKVFEINNNQWLSISEIHVYMRKYFGLVKRKWYTSPTGSGSSPGGRLHMS